ncbi:MAG: radical SAM protein [Nitrospirae bacterium YQR-1]
MRKEFCDPPLPANFHIIKNSNEVKRTKEYEKYRELWEKTAAAHIITPFPLHLDIEVTSYCNLKCPMCPRTHRVKMGQWESKHMSLDFFKKIIDSGATLGLCAVNLNNFGESLMNKDLPLMVKYAKDSGIIDIMLHTNGTLLTEELSKQLIFYGLDTIVFSFDSITKELYEKIRKGADFETTVNNIRRFAALKRQLDSASPQIRVGMVYMKENAQEKDSFVSFWGGDVDVVSYTDYRNQDGLDETDRYIKRKSANPAFACPSLWQRMTINVNGLVTACCRDAGKRLVIGDLNTGATLKEIWDGDALRDARYLHEIGRAAEIPACNGCDHIRGHQV